MLTPARVAGSWTPRRLDELFTWDLRYFPGVKKQIVMVEAYCDHSFTGTGDTRTVTLAAVVASGPNWLRFSDAWNAAMERGGARGKILHMADLVSGHGDFPGWQDVEKQTALFKRLVPVVRDGISWGFVYSLQIAPWEEYAHIIQPTDPKHAVLPVSFVFQAVLERIVEATKPRPEEPLHCYMEEDSLAEHDVTRHFHYLRELRGWRENVPLIRPLPKGPAPLQAADMLAYEQSRHVSERILPGRDGERGLYRELERCRRLEFFHVDRQGVAQHAALLAHIGNTFADYPKAIAALRQSGMRAEKRTQQDRSALGVERKKARQKRQP